MKKNFLLLAIVSLLFFSCKKEAVIETPVPAQQKMTELKFSTSTVTLTYNQDGSIKKIYRENSPYVYDIDFSYSPGKAYYTSYVDGKKSEFGEFTMVNGKAIAKEWKTYNLNGEVMQTYHETFTYNSKGLLEKYIYTNGAYWVHNFNDQGDITSAQYFDENGILTHRTELEYWDIQNKFPYMTDNNIWGELFFVPRYSKHLLKVKRAYEMPGNSLIYGVSYNYDLNAAGYPVKTYGEDLPPYTEKWSFTAKFE